MARIRVAMLVGLCCGRRLSSLSLRAPRREAPRPRRRARRHHPSGFRRIPEASRRRTRPAPTSSSSCCGRPAACSTPRATSSRDDTSRAPVVVFVGPSGARAASAGFILTLAADVAVMAPGTHIGAAHPSPARGQRWTRRCRTKAASDTAAYVRSLAEARGRNVELAAEAVMKAARSPIARRSRRRRR